MTEHKDRQRAVTNVLTTPDTCEHEELYYQTAKVPQANMSTAEASCGNRSLLSLSCQSQ